MAKSKLSRKYQMVIPKGVREEMGLSAGMILSVRVIGDGQALLTKQPESYVDALDGLGEVLWKSLGGTEKYIKNERASWQK